MYIEPFAEQRVFAIGLEPPPMMWIFEWDILTGDSAVLDVIYAISRDATGGDIEQAIAGGDQARRRCRDACATSSQATDAATWHDAAMRDAFVGTMDYEVDVLRLLASYRAMILHQAQWHDTLSADAYAAWEADRDEFEALAARPPGAVRGRHRLPRVQPHRGGARRAARRPRSGDGVDRARTAAAGRRSGS